MNMLSYLLRYPEKVSDIARMAGTKPVYLRQVARGHRKASHTLAKEIQRATNGAVTVHDLRPDIFGPDPTAEQAA